MEPAVVGLCLSCFGETFASIRLWINLEFVILSPEILGWDCTNWPVQLLQCHLSSWVGMDNTLQWYSCTLWDGLGTVLWWSWVFVHRFEAWRRIWTCLEDIGIFSCWAEETQECVVEINLNWHVWMHECIRSDSGIEHLNANGIVCTGCIFVNSRNPEWSFRKPIELFNGSCVLWTFVFGRNFHRKFLNWNEPSCTLDWTEFEVAEFS